MGHEVLPDAPGGATVSNDLVFTTLYDGELVALDRSSGAVIYEHRLPTSANSTIAIAGNMVLVPGRAPKPVRGLGAIRSSWRTRYLRDLKHPESGRPRATGGCGAGFRRER